MKVRTLSIGISVAQLAVGIMAVSWGLIDRSWPFVSVGGLVALWAVFKLFAVHEIQRRPHA